MTATTTVRERALKFPDGFVWGAATAAFQVEGATGADGRGPSIWDTFCRRPGAVAGGATGDTACDHYHRYAGDVALMAELGIEAYRFSVSWPRVQPPGSGPANQAGLDFYQRLVDELLEAGIAPYATLYHWDLPQALEDAGGWTARDTAHRFADYARLVYDRIGDRVHTWLTVNEPWVAASLGYGVGVHAPGRTSAAEALVASHHLLLAHGLGARALREAGAREIALTLNLAPVLTPAQVHDPAAVPAEADAEAVARVDCLINRQFLDPVLRGEYPATTLDIIERIAGLGHIRDGDLAAINQRVDLLGINYYTPCVVRARPGEPANPAFPGTEGIEFTGGQAPTTAVGWPIVPTALTRLLLRLSRDYPGVGLIVTENGAAFEDEVTGEHVHDADRTAFLEGHLRAAHAALEAGADLRGYHVWSLLDNFEWAEGYRPRFGIVHVDFATQRRRPKDSALWYRDVIARGGLGSRRPRRPTLEEVAARAGVSRSTVSRVINGERTVAPQARETVMHAVAELGYVPNSAARSLVTRRTDTVALVVLGEGAVPSPDGDDDPVFAAAVRSAAHALERAGRQVILVPADSGDSRRRAEGYLTAGHADGALLVPSRSTDPMPGTLAAAGVPVVALGRPRAAVPYVEADGAAGARAAIRHLVAAGRRRIAMIAGPVEGVAVDGRLAGYRAALREAGLPELVVSGGRTRAAGAAAARGLLAGHPEVDAVFAASDLPAIGVLRELRTAGRRVPDDVAVVGFGDVDAAAYTTPALTTVREDVAGQAVAAVRMLLAAIEGDPVASAILPCELVVRESG
ncbi:hypothetical protein Sru01_40440 [Sphaerisporangium rufum]|uniref:Beta-glucosidase n=1 Tax=Sphaerisporangium rufum TaxID=1381558 RepID=A0A919V1W2_9ACTN|nr:GH1 family beta-glucosidase [Sphaerisporangium rufum]GII79062.1 hypothetical protein Sru01_40440 [Sphaerisporangium rufum]